MISLIGSIIMTIVAIFLNVFNNSEYAFELKVNSDTANSFIIMILDSGILDYICQYTIMLAFIFWLYFIIKTICKKHDINTISLDIFELVMIIVFIGSYTIFTLIGFINSVSSGGEFFGTGMYILVIEPFLAIILLSIWIKRLYNKFLKTNNEVVVNENNVIKNIIDNIYSKKIVIILLICVVFLASFVAFQSFVFAGMSEDGTKLIGMFVINPMLVIWLDIYGIIQGIKHIKKLKDNS